MFPGEQLIFSNIALLSSGLHLRSEPHLAGEDVQGFTFYLGRVIDSSKAASITFLNLRLASDDGLVVYDGPWEFHLPSELLATDPPLDTTPLDVTVEHHGMTITVSRLESRASGLYVHYSIETQADQPVIPLGTGISLQFGDGSLANPVTVDSASNGYGNLSGHEPIEMVAMFEQVRTGGTEAKIVFGPYLEHVSSSATIIISDPMGDWRSDPVLIDGEEFFVTRVVLQEDEERLYVTVANDEAIADASILFLSASEGEVTAVDDLGQGYKVFGATTGMRRDEQGLMGAGESMFVVSAPVEADIAQLMLTTTSSSKLIPAIDGVEIVLP